MITLLTEYEHLTCMVYGCWYISEVVSLTLGWRQLTTKYFRHILTSSLLFDFPCRAFTFCFRSLRENIGWFALHVSPPQSDDQNVCGWLSQFALVTSFSRSHDERAEDSVVSPLFNKVLREGRDEWKCLCNRKLWDTHTTHCSGCVAELCVCVFMLKVSAHYQKVACGPSSRDRHYDLPLRWHMLSCRSPRPERHMRQK